MENFFPDEVSNSKEPPQTMPAQISPEDLERMKQQARELAVAQYYAQQQAVVPPPSQAPSNQQSQVVYVRRNLTIAELLIIFAVSCGLVYGIPAAWNFTSQTLSRIEIRMK